MNAPDQPSQNISGNENQAIAHLSGGIAINKLILQPPRSPESARYSLPADPPDFTGRETEIQQIKTHLSAQWVVAIAGMAGVGKSALAIRVAHQLKAQFPGGQIYLNLRGADTPLTVESALETLLRALGVDPTQIPPELADRVSLYRSRLAELHKAQQPTFVLLDNAANSQQVRDLLPGSGACLITSRRQLDGLAGMKPLNLEALPPEQALELLEKLLPEPVQRETEAARAIVGYCGRLPLALRIAAATLMMRSWQSKRLAAYAQQLANERQRLSLLKLDNLDVRASFELSYRELEAAAAHLLGWLALLPADFGTAILLPLTESPAESMQPALAALVDGRLVDPLLHTNRYLLHDLMRLFALEKLETQAELATVQATKGRLVQWCGEQANAWENALNPGRRRQWAKALAAEWITKNTGEDVTLPDLESRLLQAALTWFEAERETLVQAFGWAADTQQRQASVALAVNLTPFFNLRGYWGDWVSTQQEALTAARQADDSWGEGAALNSLGVVYRSQGKWNEALAAHEKSLQIFRAIGNVQGEGQTLNNLGTANQLQGKWNEAIDCYEQSLKIFQAIKDVYGEGQTLNNLGVVYRFQGKWSEALAAHEQSLRIFRAIGDIHSEGQSTIGLGLVYYFQGRWSEAIDSYEKSLQICRAIGDVQGEGKTLSNLGLAYQSQGKWNKAIGCYEKDLKICQAIGDIQGEGTNLMNLGVVYQDQGKWDEAIDCYEQSLKIFRAINDVHSEGQSQGNLGNVYQFQGKWNEAIDCYEQSLKICRAIGDVHNEGQSLNNLGIVYQSQGKWNEVIDCYEQSLKICRAIGDVHGEGQTLANLGKVHERQKHLDQAISLWREALTKLHPDSPDYATVIQWLQAATQPDRPTWLNWLLPLSVLLFLIWNLISGHWLIALLGALVLLTWQWQRQRQR